MPIAITTAGTGTTTFAATTAILIIIATTIITAVIGADTVQLPTGPQSGPVLVGAVAIRRGTPTSYAQMTPMEVTMRAWIGAALLVTALGAAGPAAAAPQAAAETSLVTVSQPTDVSARQRRSHVKQRHIRRQPAPRRTYVYAPRGAYDYNARPHWYRPDPVAPFFPFAFGWGLGPSW
jgi:uncharacterized membrane protein